jgi:hypothetical protein
MMVFFVEHSAVTPISYVEIGYVVAALGGTNAATPVWRRRSDILSLSISFVQCVIYLSPLHNASFYRSR